MHRAELSLCRRLGTSVIVSICGGILLPVAGSADDFHGVGHPGSHYSDAFVVEYEIDRTELAAEEAACSLSPLREIPSMKCNIAFHRFCEERKLLTGFGYVSDYQGTGEADDLVRIVCLTQKAGRVEALPAVDLETENTSCEQGTVPSIPCSNAAHQYCYGPGYATGFGPVDRFSQNGDIFFEVACLRAEVVEMLGGGCAKATVNEVMAVNSFCNLADLNDGVDTSGQLNNHCYAAFADICTERGTNPESGCEDYAGGLVGGFGPRAMVSDTDHGIANVRIDCMDKREEWVANSILPESPSLPLDILHLGWGEGSGAILHNVLQHNRAMSFDGRIYATSGSGTGENKKLSIRSQVPETFTEPLSRVVAGTPQRSYIQGLNQNIGYAFEVDQEYLHDSVSSGHLKLAPAFCDPHYPTDFESPPVSIVGNNESQSVPSRRSNPRPCSHGGNAGFDCYDLVLVDAYDVTGGGTELWGAPVTIVIERPKGDVGSSARPMVADVQVGEPYGGTLTSGSCSGGGCTNGLIEPNITGNGKLIVAQVNGMIQYAYSDTPCDVEAWLSDFQDISEMEDDPRTGVQSFGLAKYSIRDMENRYLESGEPFRGAYPWVDRDGDNMMFIQGKQTPHFVDPSVAPTGSAGERYEVVGTPAGGPPEVVNTAAGVEEYGLGNPKIGLTFFGLWTHGKMITPDTRTNSVDMALKGALALRLYSDGPIGGTEVGPDSKENLNSIENQFLFLPNLRPDTPRDVVWHISSNHDTVEYAFDDVVDPWALVVSEMTPTINSGNGLSSKYNDGFEYTTGAYAGLGFTHPAHLANHATSTQWEVPVYGYLLGGARAEPVAAGGETGKGLWCDGIDDRLEFLVDHDQALWDTSQDQSWLYTVSIDTRYDSSEPRRVLELPDGTFLDLVDPDEDGGFDLQLGHDSTIVNVDIPPILEISQDVWTSLAISSTPLGSNAYSVNVYLDGFLLESMVRSTKPTFQLTPGRVTLCHESDGFHGWVDNFRVLAQDPNDIHERNPEVVCNLAGGTLVGLYTGDDQLGPPLDDLHARATVFPGASHAAIGVSNFDYFACERPNPAGTACLGHQRRPESNTAYAARCVRDELTFEDSLIEYALPRPNLANDFCSRCHHSSNQSATLTPAALTEGTVNMEDDARRQPLQPPPKIFGMIPAHYLATDHPCVETEATDGFEVEAPPASCDP
ncbi:MAG: hypothetical protein K8J08_18305 [Thermoanaerobaculia bacterium]|nr:hypothetical protein [Thermoanaerobaculia bacterium]